MAVFKWLFFWLPKDFKRTLRLSSFGRFIAWKLGMESRVWEIRPEDSDCEPAVQMALKKAVKPGFVCLDLGANYGFLSEVMANAVGPTGKVFAFEAVRSNVEIIKKRTKYRKLQSVLKPIHMAVSDGSASTVALYFGKTEASQEFNIVGNDCDGNQTSQAAIVPATALDSFFSEEQRIDFVKMDIEGAAGLALNGMKRILNRYHPAFLIEFHYDAEWACKDLLLAMGYRFYDLDGVEFDATGDAARRYHCLVRYQ